MRRRVIRNKKKRFKGGTRSSLSKIVWLLLPTVVFGCMIIILNLIPKCSDIKIRFVTNQVSFICDHPKIELMQAIFVKKIALRYFSPFTVQFKELYDVSSGSEGILLSENSNVNISGLDEKYSEIEFYDGRYKIASLEIGRKAVISISLQEADSLNRVKLEINKYPAKMHVQLFSELARIRANKCSLFGDSRDWGNDSALTEEKHFAFVPAGRLPIGFINDFENNLMIDLHISDEILGATQIFETGKNGLPIKRLGFKKSDVLLDNPLNPSKAKCLKFQVGKLHKEEFQNNEIICKSTDFNNFKIDSLTLRDHANGKIHVQLSGKTNTFRAGLSNNSLNNVVPSYFQHYLKTEWAKIAVILAWLFSTSLGVFQVFRDNRRQR